MLRLAEPSVSNDTFMQAFNLSGDQEALNTLRQTLNLNKPPFGQQVAPWEFVKAALLYRKQNYDAYHEAMNDFVHAFDGDTGVLNAIGSMRGKFIALFSANKIDPGSYHTYPHGVEMSADPGEFSAGFYNQKAQSKLCSQFEADLWQVMVNAIGAAHDIVQGKGAPANERLTAEIFIAEMQKMLAEFKSKSNLTATQHAALDQFGNVVVPFLAQECLINGTFLLFGSGKRDFANILHQVHHIISPGNPEFGNDKNDTQLSAAVMSVALADTRRSEMNQVLDKQALLNSVPEHLIKPLEQVLRMTGLLAENETIDQLKKDDKREVLRSIEGFLLRVGQNVRMTTELAGVFAKDEQQKELAASRLGALQAGRRAEVGSFSLDIDTTKHLLPFLKSIGGDFGEAAFAKALGHINNTELVEQAKRQGLESLVVGSLDLKGWEQHAQLLMNLNAACEKLPHDGDELKAVAQVLMFIASKPPGHKVGRDILLAMENELALLSAQVKWGGVSDAEKEILGKKIENLAKDIVNIKKSNPELTFVAKAKAPEQKAREPKPDNTVPRIG